MTKSAPAWQSPMSDVLRGLTALEAREAAHLYNEAARRDGQPADAVAVSTGRTRQDRLPSKVWTVLHGPLDFR